MSKYTKKDLIHAKHMLDTLDADSSMWKWYSKEIKEIEGYLLRRKERRQRRKQGSSTPELVKAFDILSDTQKFARLETRRIYEQEAKDRNLPELLNAGIRFGNARVSKAHRRGSQLYITYAQLDRHLHQSFLEYRNCEWVIKGLPRTGWNSVLLVVLHETAHIICYAMKEYNANHGPIFQKVYKELIDKYFRVFPEVTSKEPDTDDPLEEVEDPFNEPDTCPFSGVVDLKSYSWHNSSGGTELSELHPEAPKAQALIIRFFYDYEVGWRFWGSAHNQELINFLENQGSRQIIYFSGHSVKE